jgi:hypothetical protein
MTKQFHFTYKVTCTTTNKWYLGVHSTNVVDDGYFGSGKIVSASLRKHGVQNHTREIIEFYSSRAEALAAEKELITEEMIRSRVCMNLVPGGGGNGAILTTEQILKAATAGGQALKLRRQNDPEFAKQLCEKISAGKLGRKQTAEHRQALRGPRGPNPKMQAIKSMACTVDGITIYPSRVALILALGQGNAGKRSPNFRYV